MQKVAFRHIDGVTISAMQPQNNASGNTLNCEIHPSTRIGRCLVLRGKRNVFKASGVQSGGNSGCLPVQKGRKRHFLDRASSTLTKKAAWWRYAIRRWMCNFDQFRTSPRKAGKYLFPRQCARQKKNMPIMMGDAVTCGAETFNPEGESSGPGVIHHRSDEHRAEQEASDLFLQKLKAAADGEPA